jgi:hypothetical protein
MGTSPQGTSTAFKAGGEVGWRFEINSVPNLKSRLIIEINIKRIFPRAGVHVALQDLEFPYLSSIC